MKLSDYPVPAGNNGMGWHWLPQLADSAPLARTQELFEFQRAMGFCWTKLVTSPGGDPSWERGCGRLGACEMTFTVALDLGFGVDVRIFNSWKPPYWTPAVEANLRHLCRLAGDRQFYVECANEIDAEAARPITEAEALAIARAIVEFHDGCYRVGGGQIIPVFPSFGYGGPGYNWFELVHRIGRGEILDECAVAVHNYPHANRHYEPWDPDYIAGTPVTQAEFEAMPWRWKGTTLDEVNRWRAENAAKRAKLSTDDELMAAFASGWYTYLWALLQLDRLGHTETPLHLTETGERVDEAVPWEPRIDPLLHKERTLALIEHIGRERRIHSSALWLLVGKMFAPIDYAWEDACAISPIWDRKYNETMPEGEYEQIVTPGRLPIIDYLLANPVPAGKAGGNGGGETPPDEPEGDDTVSEPTQIPEPILDVPADWGVSVVRAAPRLGDHCVAVKRVRLVPPEANDGRHNIYVNVEDHSGQRLYNSTVEMLNTGNGYRDVIPLEKQAPEPMGNYSMQKGDTIHVWISTAAGQANVVSDCVVGMHTRHPDIGIGSTWGHHSFEITFVYVGEYVETEPEPEQPQPSEVNEQDIRNAAWNRAYPSGGVAYLPTAAFATKARELGLGAPVTNEFDAGPFRVQAFALGIVYCEVGDWGNIVTIAW